jgi:hypothetical protein
MQSWTRSFLSDSNSRELLRPWMNLTLTREVKSWLRRGKRDRMNPSNVPSQSVSSKTRAHLKRLTKTFPSLPSGVEIPTASCHPPHPQTSKGYTVSLSYATPSPLSRSFTLGVVSSVKEPSCEDTEQELKERVYRSALSVVDLEHIRHTFPILVNQNPQPSSTPLSLQMNNQKPPRLLKATRLQEITSPLLLVEILPTAPPPLPWINQRLNIAPKPSPHQLPARRACCPIVHTHPSHYHDNHEKQGKRRRGKPRNKNKLVP